MLIKKAAKHILDCTNSDKYKMILKRSSKMGMWEEEIKLELFIYKRVN